MNYNHTTNKEMPNYLHNQHQGLNSLYINANWVVVEATPPFSSYTKNLPTFLKNASVFKFKRPVVFLKEHHLFKKDGILFLDTYLYNKCIKFQQKFMG